MAFNLHDIIKKDKGEKDRLPMSVYVRDTDTEQKFISTGMIILDLGISAKVRGGIPKGKLTMIPGPSKMGKSMISMSLAKNAQKDGMSVVLIDTENSYSQGMAKGFGIDMDRFELFQGPGVNSIEAVKGILVTLSENIPINERENLLVIVDSWGAFVTMKTIKDAQTGNTANDMTEAKNLNNLANVLLCTGFTSVVTNHVYMNTGIVFGNPTKIRGGTRVYYLSSAVILGVSRSREKDKDNDVTGTVVSCQNEKGRFSKEYLKFEFRIKMSGGLDMFYGLLPFALESGIVEKTKAGVSTVYVRTCDPDQTTFTEAEVYTPEFWKPIFKEPAFVNYIEDAFKYDGSFDDNSRFFEEEDYEELAGEMKLEYVPGGDQKPERKITKTRTTKKQKEIE